MSVFLTSLPEEEEEEEDEEEGEEKRIRRRKKGDPNVDTYWRNWGSQYHAREPFEALIVPSRWRKSVIAT